ncbi:MAG: protein dehydratase [Frankiales bacterium]|nr:protein dehydratase [Frankiales bacterium]
MPDDLRSSLRSRVGQPMGPSLVAPDPVNAPMIRHWVDALDDRNPLYASCSVAPPAMLQTWTMGRPTIQGIGARGGAPGAVDPTSVLAVLAAEGYTGTLATNTVLTFDRYLELGDVVSTDSVLASVGEQKHTGLGKGYFISWSNTWTDASGEVVGSQLFTVLKFAPGPPPESRGAREAKPVPEPSGEELPPLDLDVTPTLIVAGALATRDFMPVHHDRDYAQAQGAPDIFMSILTSNGYVSRFVTDWAGPSARLTRISTRLGAPAVPGNPLAFRGRLVANGEVLVTAGSALGNHLTSTVHLTR